MLFPQPHGIKAANLQAELMRVIRYGWSPRVVRASLSLQQLYGHAMGLLPFTFLFHAKGMSQATWTLMNMVSPCKRLSYSTASSSARWSLRLVATWYTQVTILQNQPFEHVCQAWHNHDLRKDKTRPCIPAPLEWSSYASPGHVLVSVKPKAYFL